MRKGIRKVVVNSAGKNLTVTIIAKNVRQTHAKCPFHRPISFELLSATEPRFYENGACNPRISLLPLPFFSLTKLSKETIKFRKRRDYSSSFSLSLSSGYSSTATIKKRKRYQLSPRFSPLVVQLKSKKNKKRDSSDSVNGKKEIEFPLLSAVNAQVGKIQIRDRTLAARDGERIFPPPSPPVDLVNAS